MCVAVTGKQAGKSRQREGGLCHVYGVAESAVNSEKRDRASLTSLLEISCRHFRDFPGDVLDVFDKVWTAPAGISPRLPNTSPCKVHVYSLPFSIAVLMRL